MASEESVLHDIRMRISGDEWPELEELGVVGDTFTLSLSITESIRWFDGHFPAQAVLPGVVQIHWATQLAKIIFSYFTGVTPHFKAVNNVKFKTMILPKQTVDLVLRYDEAKSAVRFAYRMADDEFSTGIILFVTP